MKRQRRAVTEWEELVERWRASGLPGREFADAHGLKVSTLYRWSKRLAAPVERRDRTPRSAAQRGAAFAEIHVTPPERATGRIEVRSGRGLVVCVDGEVADDALLRVLRVVSQC